MSRVPELKSFDAWLDEYELERSAPEWRPISLGFGSIDADTRGVSAGQVCLIAARSGVGKTQLENTVLHNFTRTRPDAGVLCLSLEMPGAEWAERQLAISADVAPEQVEVWAKAGELRSHSADFLKQMRNVLLCEDHLRVNDLEPTVAQARKLLPESVPLRLVLIDYLGMIDGIGQTIYERTSMVAKKLKTLAKGEKVALVVATQLSRAAGDGSEPVTLEMMRDSGVVEESADIIIGCWQPGAKAGLAAIEAAELRDVMSARLLKARRGKKGRTVNLRFRSPSRVLYEPADVFTAATS